MMLSGCTVAWDVVVDGAMGVVIVSDASRWRWSLGEDYAVRG